jgi:hypothetical protein
MDESLGPEGCVARRRSTSGFDVPVRSRMQTFVSRSYI